MNVLPLLILVALNGAIDSGVPKHIERFGGAPTQVAVTFIRFPEQNVSVEASIYLDGDSLLTPVGLPVKLTVNSNEDPRLLVGTFEIPLPEVQKPVVFRVVIMARTVDSEPAPCGEFRITAFQKHFFEEGLGAPESLPEIAIAGTFPGLRELLDENRLRHRDINLKQPDALQPGTIVVAEVPPNVSLDGYFTDSRKLLFASAASASKPWILDSKARSFTVNSAPPADFRESPFAQRMLKELLVLP